MIEDLVRQWFFQEDNKNTLSATMLRHTAASTYLQIEWDKIIKRLLSIFWKMKDAKQK